MEILHLDRYQIILMETNLPFEATRDPFPQAGFTIPREIDNEAWDLKEDPPYITCTKIIQEKRPYN
jgi:hypothetical protein